MREFQSAEGFGPSLLAAVRNISALSEIGIESLTQYLPAIPGIALSTGLAGPMGGAAATGAYSYQLDRNATLLSLLAEATGNGGITRDDPYGP